MTTIDVIPVSKVEAGVTSADGEAFALTVSRPDGTKLSLALPAGQLMALADLAAVGHTQSRKLRQVDPNWKEYYRTTWFELSTDKATGAIILSLTFGAGGTLSFSLPDNMPAQLVETLQALSGKSPATRPRGIRPS